MNWKQGFDEALLKFVRTELGKPEAVEVTGFEQVMTEGYRWSEVTFESGYAMIEITYYDGRTSRLAEWRGDFGDLLRRLTEL